MDREVEFKTATLRTMDPQRIVVSQAYRPGWLRVENEEHSSIRSLRTIPGTTTGLDGDQGLLIPSNTVQALPDLFHVQGSDTESYPHSGYPQALRPYQIEAADFIRGRPGTYLGYDIGIGKTITSAAAIASMGIAPVLIVGPLISRGTWCGDDGEVKKWLGFDVTPLKGVLSPILPHSPSGWFFIHYDILNAWCIPIMFEMKPAAVIMDEIHLLRGRFTKRTKTLQAIVKMNKVERRVGLSGTPIENRVRDLHAQLDLVEPFAWGSNFDFSQRYADPEMEKGRWHYRGLSHEEELRSRLQSVYIRKTRLEVLKDLPPITRQRIEAELEGEDYAAYKAAEHDVRAYLRSKGTELSAVQSGAHLARLTLMMKTLATAKVHTTACQVVNLLETSTHVVVFGWFKEPLVKLVEAIKAHSAKIKVFLTSGDESPETRIKKATAFADAESAVFVGTIASVSTSMNQLVASDIVVFNDLWWTQMAQAEGRLWRSGQRRPVHSFFICGKDTVDDHILEGITRKAREMEISDSADDTKGLVEAAGPRSLAGGDPVLDDLLARIQAMGDI